MSSKSSLRRIVVYEVGFLAFFGGVYLFLWSNAVANAFQYCAAMFVFLSAVVSVPEIVSAYRRGRA